MQPGVQRFIDDMTELGLNPSVEAGLVIYQITPIDGAHAGGRGRDRRQCRGVGPLAPGASTLGSFPREHKIPKDQQPGIAETWLAHA